MCPATQRGDVKSIMCSHNAVKIAGEPRGAPAGIPFAVNVDARGHKAVEPGTLRVRIGDVPGGSSNWVEGRVIVAGARVELPAWSLFA